MITIPEGARAILVFRNDDGSTRQKVVSDNCSALNIEADLLSHLDHQPYSDAWLTELRDYVDQRLSARKEAAASGRIAIPSVSSATWTTMGKPA